MLILEVIALTMNL